MLLLSGPNIAGNEWKYVKDCLDTGWVSSVGAYVDQFEKMSAEFACTKYAVATSSGTTALHICLLMMGVNADDYVITPNVTFIATCNSIKYTGADPILIDIHPGTWQMDLDLLEQFFVEETEQKNGACHYKKNGRRFENEKSSLLTFRCFPLYKTNRTSIGYHICRPSICVGRNRSFTGDYI